MFIEEYPGLIAPALCEQIIARFEAHPARKPSVASAAGRPTITPGRSGTSLACDTPDWQDVVTALIPALHQSLGAYAKKFRAVQMLIDGELLSCTAPIIERVDPGQGFAWHYDQTSHSRERVIAGLLYLRTIAAGGSTEFREQARTIQPEAGKIALFPPYWTHLHRGVTPTSEAKYVMSFFWIYGAGSTSR
jgi:hypothetical protein